MKQLNEHGIIKLKTKDLSAIKGGHPVLVVLGVITTGVSLGRALDLAGEWFLEGWNNPR